MSIDRSGQMLSQVAVMRDISPDDEMFQTDKAFHSATEGAPEAHYFSVGQSALECIDVALRAARIPPSSIRQILDLPCGHGRVLRYLRAAFPEAAITACDLNQSGVDYCAATFGAIPLYSNQNPKNVGLQRNAYDLIWVGSLLTHVPLQRWAEFLAMFRDCLKSNGLLVFSTHGRLAYDALASGRSTYGLPYWRVTSVLRGYERTGFGYAHYDRAGSYGISLSAPEWVMRQVMRTPELRIVHASEHAWDGHQDIFACVRDPLCGLRESAGISWKTALKHSIREKVSGGAVDGPT